ncbi:MAG: CoA transferase [Alphaproteobacteria bacterium]|nr:CoA transferase [Alphaproteobacteria bacterium]
MKHILGGIVVVDFSQVVAGPACTRLMAELGAEVIKVELAPAGDPSRLLPSARDGHSAYFIQHNQGKKGICVDPRQAEGLEILKALIAKADVLVENFSPGAFRRLGLGWDVVRALNPNLIMCSISAFGQTGPLSALPGYDFIAQAYAGVTSMIGEPDAPPALAGLVMGDVGTGITALATINGALFWRERNGGRGQYLDISLLDYYFFCHEMNIEVASLDGTVPTRNGSHHYNAAPLGIYRAPQGFIMIVTLQHQWPSLCQALERPDLLDNPRFIDIPARLENIVELTAIIEDWLQSQPDTETAVAKLEDARVPVAPILTVTEAMNHPHLLHRGTVRALDHPVLGQFKVPANPLRFSEGLPPPPSQAPMLGEHNREVLRQHIGIADDQLAALERAGVLVADERLA